MNLPIWHVFTLASQAKHSHNFKYQKCIYLYWSLWRRRVCLKLGLLVVAEHFGDQQLLYTLCLDMLVITNICNLCLKSCVFVCALLCFWVSKDLSFIGAGYCNRTGKIMPSYVSFAPYPTFSQFVACPSANFTMKYRKFAIFVIF